MLPGITRLTNNNSPEIFFTQDALASQQYLQFRQDFGSHNAIRVALRGPNIWTSQGLDWLGLVENRVSNLEGVETVIGLAAYHRWLLNEWPPTQPKLFRDEILKDKMSIGWMSPKGDTIVFLVVFKDLTQVQERELLTRVERLISKTPEGVTAQLSGLLVLQRAIDKTMKITSFRIFPILVLLALIFLMVVFRSPWEVVIPLGFVAVSQVILFGLMGYLGITLNCINIILIPILFVISLATAVHVLIYFREIKQREENLQIQVVKTYENKGWPILWAGLTTMVAFGSLITASLPPVQSLGLWTAAGIGIMTLLAFTFYPLLLTIKRESASKAVCSPFERRTQNHGLAVARWSIRNRTYVIGITIILFALGVSGILQLRIEENLAEYLSQNHPVRVEMEKLHKETVGVFSADLIISRAAGNLNDQEKEANSFHNPLDQKRLAMLSQNLRSESLIYGAISSGDLVEATISSLMVEGQVSDNIRWLALGLLQTAPESRKLLHALVTPDGLKARINLMLPILSFEQVKEMLDLVLARSKKVFPAANTCITGQYPLISLAQRTLLRNMIFSLSLTLFCVLVVFRLVLGSTGLTLLVLVPNFWPVVLVLGVGGWFQLPMDGASIMTASIVLGLAVDDTFHSLGHYLRLVRRGNPAEAVCTTLKRTAPAHVLTSLILTMGFAICTFTSFLPLVRMGSLCALAILAALAGDLFLIPALLSRLTKSMITRIGYSVRGDRVDNF
jgi:predicted RND superfamily exporter protein